MAWYPGYERDFVTFQDPAIQSALSRPWRFAVADARKRPGMYRQTTDDGTDIGDVPIAHVRPHAPDNPVVALDQFTGNVKMGQRMEQDGQEE